MLMRRERRERERERGEREQGNEKGIEEGMGADWMVGLERRERERGRVPIPKDRSALSDWN